MYVSTDQVLPPCLVEVAKIRKHHHRRQIACYRVLVGWIPHPIRGTGAQSLQHDAGGLRGGIPRAEKQRRHGQGDVIDEFVREEEQLQQDLQRHEREEDLEPSRDLQHKRKPLDLLLMLGQQFGGEDIRPEFLVFAERHLQLDRIGVVALAGEHGHGVVEDVAPALHALVEPGGAMLVLVEGHGEGLPAAVVHRVDEGDFEFFGMLGEVMRRGHAWEEESGARSQESGEGLCQGIGDGGLPAAPAPTTSTLFLPLLFLLDMVTGVFSFSLL